MAEKARVAEQSRVCGAGRGQQRVVVWEVRVL